MLQWMEESHVPTQWNEELIWLNERTKGKGWHVGLLKMIAAETIYPIWHYRNNIIFGNNVDIIRIVTTTIEVTK